MARLAVIAFTLALAYGIWYSYSVILVALLREYGWSRSVLAGAFSVFTLVHGAANPLVGALCDRVRPLRLMAAGGAALGAALWADSYIATPVQLWVGWDYYVGAWKALRNGAANMDVLVALGSSVAYGYSIVIAALLTAGSTAAGEHVYFETAALIITLIKLGKLLATGTVDEVTWTAGTSKSATPSPVVPLFWKSGLKSTARSKTGLKLTELETGPPTTKVSPGWIVPESCTRLVV